MEEFEKRFFLTENPFGTAPKPNVEVWADRAQLKSDAESLIRSALLSSPSRIVATFHGEWGTGKTHMSSYFSRPEILKKFAEEFGLSEPLAQRLTLPARDMIDSLYSGILDLIDFQTLRKAITSLATSSISSVEQRVQRLMPLVQDKIIATAFATANMPNLQGYLYGTSSAKDLKSLQVPHGISSASEKVKALRAVFNLLASVYSRIILWIDDAERLQSIAGRDVSEFQIFIRDILDNVPINLNIILLFTLTPTQDLEDVLLYLGDALRSRLYRTIQVGQLTKEDFLTYISDMLEFYRSQSPKKKVDQFFPFDGKETVELFYKRMKEKDVELKRKDASLPLTPRNINQIASNLLEMAVERKANSIDDSLVNEWFSKN